MIAPTAVGSPFAGWVIALDAVPDRVFAERMLGDGVAVDPLDGVLRAPVAGRVVSVHPARHAVTIESDDGAVLLLHVGLDTVALGGEGFEALVAAGSSVAPGDALIGVDLDAVGRRATSLITPVILTNSEAFTVEPLGVDRLVAAGEPLFHLRRKAAQDHRAVESSTVVCEHRLVLPLRDGLHARPAARIAALARRYRAKAEIVAADGRVASAVSPVGMLALALPHGAALSVRAAGPDADEAVEALAALLASGMGEMAAIVEPAFSEPPAGPLPDVLNGVTAVPGVAIGPAFHLPGGRVELVETGSGVATERAALAAALADLRARLDATSVGPGDSAAIAAAHGAFLADPDLLAEAERLIAAGKSAGFAWRQAIGRFEAMLGASANRRFAERIDDLRDLERGVLAVLLGLPPTPDVPAGAILLAEELLPSQLMALTGAGLAGIATVGGGATSHVAIIAAGLGLPMLVAVGADVARIDDGTPLVIDGAQALLMINPSDARLAALREEAARTAAFQAVAETHMGAPAVTRDGARIEVFANLGSLADAHAALAAGAEGCGLLRTEFLFLDRPNAPAIEEQRASYQAIADALGARPLIVRTLDIGADKPAPYLPMPREENPALGLRGLRLGLAQPSLIEAQLTALVGVEGDVKIMLPMVVEPGEVVRVRAMLERIAGQAGRTPPALGIMVETPAAAMMARSLAGVADFFSIGSNDLTQYALAMDRGNPAVAAGLDGLHPAVLRLIAITVEGAAEARRWVGVCGGIAADPLAVPILVGLGITELSVPPSAVAAIKEHVRRTSLAECRELAARALLADSAAQVRALARAMIEGEGA